LKEGSNGLQCRHFNMETSKHNYKLVFTILFGPMPLYQAGIASSGTVESFLSVSSVTRTRFQSAPSTNSLRKHTCFTVQKPMTKQRLQIFLYGILQPAEDVLPYVTSSLWDEWGAIVHSSHCCIVTEYGTALTNILPILFLYLNTVTVTTGTEDPSALRRWMIAGTEVSHLVA
jgi:hypothetical protein